MKTKFGGSILETVLENPEEEEKEGNKEPTRSRKGRDKKGHDRQDEKQARPGGSHVVIQPPGAQQLRILRHGIVVLVERRFVEDPVSDARPAMKTRKIQDIQGENLTPLIEAQVS